MAPDGNEPLRMEAARGGLCPRVDAKRLLKEEEEEEDDTMGVPILSYFQNHAISQKRG